MLYPDFNDLLTIKDRKSDIKHPFSRSSKNLTSGSHASFFRGQGLEFDAVREYVPGDDIRSIDWRVTARTGTPHLKLFKEERERHLFLVIDVNRSMRFGTRNTFKSVQAARISAWLGWRGLKNHDRLSGALYGDVKEGMKLYLPSRTSKSFSQLLRDLTLPPEEAHEMPLEKVLEKLIQIAPSDALIYIVSDFMTLCWEQCGGFLSRLVKKCDLIFVSVNDRADQALCPVGALNLSLNNQSFLLNTEDEKGRHAWEQQWLENRASLKNLKDKYKIPLIELTTESNLPFDLFKSFKSLGRKK